MGSPKDELEVANAKEPVPGPEVRLAAVVAVCTEEGAVGHLQRVGQQVERRRSGYAGHQHGQRQKMVDLTDLKTEEK